MFGHLPPCFAKDMSTASKHQDHEHTPASIVPTRRVSKSGSHGRNRSRASIACLNCRQKKTKVCLEPVPEASTQSSQLVKCDVQRLEPGKGCTLCTNSKIECITVPNGDRRKCVLGALVAVITFLVFANEPPYLVDVARVTTFLLCRDG